jgi:hypothetical protein
MQDQQIKITCYNHLGMAVDGKFKKLIVGWIAAFGNPLGNCHQLGTGQDALDTIKIEWRHPIDDPRTLLDLEYLGFSRRGFEETAISIDPANDTRWPGLAL